MADIVAKAYSKLMGFKLKMANQVCLGLVSVFLGSLWPYDVSSGRFHGVCFFGLWECGLFVALRFGRL
ncbi:hypothetical protein Q3G72_006565 [Acer saccharum]|nr:hypothetical protein Q3G72_006565 [Acer saccharum]